MQIACTRGLLYDLGPYPAMLPGESWVLGEVWTYAESDLPEVFRVLDEIEGTNQPGYENLYDRSLVTVYFEDGSDDLASTYHYARPAELKRPIAPNIHFAGKTCSQWPYA